MGSFFLALGILFSGFFKDQIVAFVVTLLTSFVFFLVGTDFIASYIDGRVAGLGSLLADLLGVFSHYGSFIRGVIDLADVAFFLVWICVFLSLNVLYIDGRNRPGAKMIFSAALAMSVAIGMLFNYVVAGTSIARADLTQNSVYTVSKASKDIISGIDSEVQVKLYITAKDKMPTQMRNLERDIANIARYFKKKYDMGSEDEIWSRLRSDARAIAESKAQAEETKAEERKSESFEAEEEIEEEIEAQAEANARAKAGKACAGSGDKSE